MSPGEREEPRTVRGHVKRAIEDLNTSSIREGVPVDDVVALVTDRSRYSEDDVRETLEEMLLAGEVYPPGDGRVRVTPT